MPRTPDDFPGIRFEEQSIYLDQYGDLPTELGGVIFSDGYFFVKDQYGIFNLRHPALAPIEFHAPTHIGGGTDEIDGDQLDIDFNPTFYVPTASPSEVDSVDDLSAHLAGIDAYLGSIVAPASPHRPLRHLIHFIDDGPALEFTSGAFKETLPSNDPFHTSETWWESASKLQKIVELTIVRDAQKKPITEEWKMYDTDGTTVVETVTDTISYSGPFEATRARAIA